MRRVYIHQLHRHRPVPRGADIFGIATGGAERARIDATGNMTLATAGLTIERAATPR